MNKYINKSDAIDILDNLWDKVGNNSRDFYLRLRKVMYDLSTEEIIHCKDCINFYNNHLCLHWSKHGTIEVKPDDFCSYGEKNENL